MAILSESRRIGWTGITQGYQSPNRGVVTLIALRTLVLPEKLACRGVQRVELAVQTLRRTHRSSSAIIEARADEDCRVCDHWRRPAIANIARYRRWVEERIGADERAAGGIEHVESRAYANIQLPIGNAGAPILRVHLSGNATRSGHRWRARHRDSHRSRVKRKPCRSPEADRKIRWIRLGNYNDRFPQVPAITGAKCLYPQPRRIANARLPTGDDIAISGGEVDMIFRTRHAARVACRHWRADPSARRLFWRGWV